MNDLFAQLTDFFKHGLGQPGLWLGLLLLCVVVGYLLVLNVKLKRRVRATHAQFNSILKCLHGVAYRRNINEDYTLLYVSEGVKDMFGWTVQETLVRPLDFRILMHADDYAWIVRKVTKAMADRVPYQGLYRMVRSDGSQIWAQSDGVVGCDEKGRPQWLDGILMDVTELVELRQKLADCQTYNRVLFRDARLPMLLFDTVGSLCVDCNLAALDVLGFAQPEQLVGRSLEELSAPIQGDGVPTSSVLWQRTQMWLGGDGAESSWRFLGADGRALELNVLAQVVEQTQRKLLHVTLRERSQSPHLERTLQFHRQVTEHMSALLWVDPVAQRIIYANHAAQKHFGLSREAMAHKALTELGVLHSVQDFSALMTDLHKNERPITVRGHHRLANGATMNVLQTLFLAADHDGMKLIVNIQPNQENLESTPDELHRQMIE